MKIDLIQQEFDSNQSPYRITQGDEWFESFLPFIKFARHIWFESSFQKTKKTYPTYYQLLNNRDLKQGVTQKIKRFKSTGCFTN